MEEKKQYIYLGDTLDFKDFRFVKGVVYFDNEIIKEKFEKYPLLKKVLVGIDETSQALKNEKLLETISNQIREQIQGDDE